jgi:hypothetical protein
MLKKTKVKNSSKALLYAFLAVALLLTSFCKRSPDPEPYQPPISDGKQVSGDQVGLSMPNPVNYYSDPKDVVKEFAAAKNTGAKWVRVETIWSEIAPNKPSDQTDPDNPAYEWTTPDLFFKTAKANGQYVIWIVRGAPAWASAISGVGNHDTAPMDTLTYGAFCQALTLKYLPQAKTAGLKMAVEFWNEPNIGQAWLPFGMDGSSRQTQSTEFANRVIKPGFRGIRAAIDQLGSGYATTDVDILAGGLAGAVPSSDNTTTPDEFASYWYTAGAKGYFDAISDHPYAFSDHIQTSINEIFSSYGFDRLRALRQVMISNDDADKKIWCTEIGWPTQSLSNSMIGRFMPESILPDCINWAFDAWFSYDYAGPIIWFNCRDLATNDTSNENNGFGIVHTDWTLKKGYSTFKAKIK